MRTSLAQQAVDQNEVYGRWRIEGRVPGSTRKVKARCLDCTKIYEVDLYGLRRKDRGNTRCQSCSNKLISASNKLPPGLALTRNRLHEYKKSAYTRGHSWSLSNDLFQDLIFGDCYYCGKSPSSLLENAWDSMLVNGIDRVDNETGYEPNNVVSCCSECNYAKRKMSAEKFIELCKRVANNDSSRNGASS